MANNINLPEGYQRVEYLQSTDMQYIDTGIIPDADTGIQVTAMKLNIADKYILGFRNDSGNTKWAIGQFQSKLYYGYGGYYNNEWNNAPINTQVTASLNYLNDKKFIVEDESEVIPTLSFTPTRSILLFGFNDKGTVSYSNCRIYNVKISQGSEVVMDLIPVKVGTTGYMYDTVSGELFGNAGSGEFILGPDTVSSFGEGFLNYTGLKRLISWIKGALNGKQDTLTFDTTPTTNSSNPVTSGGVKAAIDALGTLSTSYDKASNPAWPVANDTYENAISKLHKVVSDNDLTVAGALNDLENRKANSEDLASVATSGNYNDLSNKPSAVTESTVSGWGFTKNTGTITGITMNGSSKGTSGVVNLGTVLTEHQSLTNYYTKSDIDNAGYLTTHQDISGKQDVLTAGDGIAINNNTVRTTGIPFGRCDSTSTSTVFTATVPGIYKLEDGVCCMVKNGVVTSASGFTLNVNGLGAKPCYSSMATGNAVTPTDPIRETTIFNINYVMMFVYSEDIVEGGAWICYRGYDSNTNTIGYQLRTNSTVMTVTDTARYYKLYFTSANGKQWVPASVNSTNNATTARAVNQRPIDPFGRIVYTSASTSYAAGANLAATTIWDQYVVTLGYSFNRTGAALALTTKAPVYIKCAPQTDGSAIIDADTPYVQALPSSNDGKIYILLGIATSATAVELVINHSVYYHDGTGIRLWTGVDCYTKAEIDTALSGKQDTLVSGTNLKTINNESLLGSGNISINGGGSSTNIEYNSSKTALVIDGGSTKYTISLYDGDMLYPSVKINDFTYSASRFPLEVNSGDILNVVVSVAEGSTCTTTMGGTTVSTSNTFSIQSVSGNIVITVVAPSGPGGDGPGGVVVP